MKLLTSNGPLRAALVLALTSLSIACANGEEAQKLVQAEWNLSTCTEDLSKANARVENLVTALKHDQTPPERQAPPPPPPPKMPEWQVVRYAPNGTVVNTIPVYSWDVKDNCVWFSQTERQQRSSVFCAGQFDILRREPQ